MLAHCGAALQRLAEGRLHTFTPELNELDVAERRPWPLASVVAELEHGYAAAAPALIAAKGKLDGVALGEWVHGGDVREGLGEPGPNESDGVEDAMVLLVERSQRQAVPATLVRLTSGRHPDPARFRLDGADPEQYHLFR